MSDWYANVVATIALLVAGYSLAWQILKARWDRPHFLVSGRISVEEAINVRTNSRTFVGLDFKAQVTNVGNVSSQVHDLYWEIEQPGVDGRRYIRGSLIGGTVDMDAATGPDGVPVVVANGHVDPPLPRSLACNEAQTWRFETDGASLDVLDLSTARRARPVVEYVSRKILKSRQRGVDLSKLYGEWELIPSSVIARVRD